MKIRVGSRESRLAVIQSQMVMEAIGRAHPDLELELVTMKTTGDRILDRTLDKVGGKGLFVKELDQALLSGRIDLAVHSMKDLPMELDPRLPVLAVSAREDPLDALVLPQGVRTLDGSLPIGCASARRAVQLGTLFPNARVAPVRGNVLTRLDKLDGGQYAALVLASAGLKRLALGGRISRVFSLQEMVPAACQGILAVQGRHDLDPWFLKEVHDPAALTCARAERGFVAALDGGCSAPVAAHARLSTEGLALTGLYAREGAQRYWVGRLSGSPEDPEALGRALAARALTAAERGAWTHG